MILEPRRERGGTGGIEVVQAQLDHLVEELRDPLVVQPAAVGCVQVGGRRQARSPPLADRADLDEEVGAEQRVVRERQSLLREFQRSTRLSGPERRPRRGVQPPGAILLLWRQARSPLECARLGGVPSACTGPLRGLLQRRGHLFVDTVRGRSEMPGAAVGVGLRVENAGEGEMRGGPIGVRRIRIHQRAHHGVAERHGAAADADQADRLGLRERVPQVQGFGRASDGLEVVLGSGEEQTALRRLRQRVDALRKGAPEPLVGGRRRGKVAREIDRQFEEGERIARGRGKDARLVGRRHRVRAHPQQAAGVLRRKRLELELGQGSERRRRLEARGGDHGHLLHPQTAGREGERVGGRTIEPMHVVEQEEDGRVLGRLDEERQGSGAHRQHVGLAVLERERGAEGARLRRGDARQQGEDRAQQLVQHGERKLRLGLDPCRGEDEHVGGPGPRLLEQCGLSDTRLADQHEYAAPPAASFIEQSRHTPHLCVAPDEHVSTIPGRLGKYPGQTARRSRILPAMRHITFSMQFRGRSTRLTPGVLTARATAPSSALITEIDDAGVRARFEQRDGEEAHLECRLTFLDDRRFEEVGTISFGNGNALRFRTAGEGTLAPCAEPGLRHGAVAWEVDGGAGSLEGATGRIVSNFLVSDTGDLTDHQLGVLFLPGNDRKGRQ